MIRLHTLVAVLALTCSGCSDSVTSVHLTRAAAQPEVDRGWIPSVLPASATQICETHDLKRTWVMAHLRSALPTLSSSERHSFRSRPLSHFALTQFHDQSLSGRRFVLHPRRLRDRGGLEAQSRRVLATLLPMNAAYAGHGLWTWRGAATQGGGVARGVGNLGGTGRAIISQAGTG